MRAQNSPSRSGLKVRELIVSGFLISPYDHERMRSGLAIEMRIWSKLCGPETCPKMFINSFIEDPSPVGRHARESGHPGAAGTFCAALDPRLRGGDKTKFTR